MFSNTEVTDINLLITQITKQQEELTNLQKKFEDERKLHGSQMDLLNAKVNKLSGKIKTQQQFFDETLLDAAEIGSVKKMHGAMDLGANLQAKNKKGQTTLHLAVLNERQNMADFILDQTSALFLIADNSGYTPIQQMAKIGHIEMLDWLYERGKLIPEFADNPQELATLYSIATPEARVFLANKKLLEAAKTGNIEGVVDALNHGADINAKGTNGETALYKAVDYQNNELIPYLIAQGADPTIRNAHQENPH